MGILAATKGVWSVRIGLVPVVPSVVVVILLAGAIALFEGGTCVQETNTLVADIAHLEDEIGFRRRSLRQALDKAESVQEIRYAQIFLTAQSPSLLDAMRGKKFDDLRRELDELYEQLELVVQDGAPVTLPQPDPWLQANYPVDVQGFLYSVSLSELSAARLAAADLENVFVARRRIPANSRVQLSPDCSIGSAMRHAFSGYRRVALSILPPA